MANTPPAAMTTNNAKYTNGFTLIEVLVALTIVALSLGAIITTSGTQASQAGYLKQKTIGHWVAMNEITRFQIGHTVPTLGTKDGSSEMANHTWYWVRTTSKMENDFIRQVTYQVFLDKKQKNKVATLHAFLVIP